MRLHRLFMGGVVGATLLLAMFTFGLNGGASIATNETQGEAVLENTTAEINQLPENVSREFERNASEAAASIGKAVGVPVAKAGANMATLGLRIGYRYPGAGRAGAKAIQVGLPVVYVGWVAFTFRRLYHMRGRS